MAKTKPPGILRRTLADAPLSNRSPRAMRSARRDEDYRPDDLFARWHRDALYFVVVMRTSHGCPETFETHAARMEHAGNGKFNLAVPMRRGWNTVKRNASTGECLQEFAASFYF